MLVFFQKYSLSKRVWIQIPEKLNVSIYFLTLHQPYIFIPFFSTKDDKERKETKDEDNKTKNNASNSTNYNITRASI